jgi:pimeloyl-ACP methyl ester carboxylesterase
MVRTSLVAFASGLLVGCSSQGDSAPSDAGPPDTGPSDSGANDTGASDAGSAPLSFTSCTLLTDPTHPPPGVTGIAAAMAECAAATVPAVWSDPTGDTMQVFVKRYRAAQQPASGQLWLLSGGPGNAGSDFEAWTFDLAKSAPTLDIYLPDHRGTGRSTFRTCGASLTPAVAQTCAASIPHLDGLTVTGAAEDLARLIDGARVPSQKVFVYGLSYGTYWAQRYLEIRPDQPAAVVLDSTLPANGTDFASFDKQFDDKAHAVLDLCKANATCAAKLGPDPLAKANQALAAVDAGTCNPGVGPLRAALGSLVANGYFGFYFERMLLPASIYRILRCNSADLAWFGTVGAYVSKATAQTPGFSDATNANIVFSDFWPNSPSVSDLQGQEKAMIAYAGFPPANALMALFWPKTPHDSYYGTWPSSPAPMLVLQGALDPQTPFADVVKPHYSGPRQYFVELPNAGHDVVRTSPMVDPNARTCGVQVMLSFLADPSRSPDTSCIAGMAPLDFGHPPAQWLAAVGVQDLWENP